jgi:hypothetical protein
LRRASNFGRPKISPALEKRIQSQLQAGKGMLAIAKALGAVPAPCQPIAREMQAGFCTSADHDRDRTP